MSNNIENRPAWCVSDRRSAFFPDGRDGLTYLLTYTHNLISKPHSVPPYTPYTTELDVAGSKAYWTTSAVRFVTAFWSDTGELASLGRRLGFVAIDRLSDGMDVTLTIKSEDLTLFLRNWSFGIKGVPQQPAVKDISRKSPCETYTYIHTCIHT